MSFQNLTPFPSISWENIDSKKQWHTTTLIRVKYIFHPLSADGKWELRLTPKQDDLFGEDIFYEKNIDLPVRYESDFVVHKPNTDIIINAIARNAYNKTIKNECNLIITDSNNNVIKKKTANLFGKHPWLSGTKKSKTTALGFIKREEKSRLKHAGTYNDVWLKNQHPYPPHDYNHLYNQAAQEDLTLKGYIPSGAKFGLSNMLSTSKDSFQLPELHCFCEQIEQNGETKRHLMNIDTVLIDVESKDSKEWAVYLSYRHYQPKTKHHKGTVVKYLPATSQLEKNNG